MTIKPDAPRELVPADLDWSEAGEPLSRIYGDVYFSRDDGLAEARHVFLDGNRLADRWRSLGPNSRFSIAETGFGSGLNFLAAWQLWRSCAPAGARLNYLATELHPLRRDDLRRVHALFPELDELASLLQSHYPPLFAGWHRVHLPDGIELDLLFGESVERLSERLPTLEPGQLSVHGNAVDAWFLDGFAPARNPEMWRNDLLDRIGWLSADGATIATFSAAGSVRRGLAERGFTMRKQAGFGRKREMLCGEFDAARRRLPESAWRGSVEHATWHLGELHRIESERRAVIIGAGISGATLARKLAERGWHVHVLEAEPAPASRASGNPQAALYGRLSPHPALLTDFVAAALAYAQRWYAPAWAAGHGQPTGLLELAERDDLIESIAARYAAAPEFVRAIQPAEAAALCGLVPPRSGLWFAGSGWLQPRALIDWLLDHPDIELVTGANVDSLQRVGDNWRAVPGVTAPVLVVATGQSLRRFEQLEWLPVRPIRGQVSQLPVLPQTASLQAVLCGDGYLTPAFEGRHCLGATYQPGFSDEQVTDDDHRANLAKLANLTGVAMDAAALPAPLAGRAAVRAATADYLPLAGPVPDRDAFSTRFGELARDSRRVIAAAGPVLPGLYVLGGMGSRGFAYAPLCAEHLASLIDTTPSPLPTPLVRALHPGRFLVRQLVRQSHRDHS